MMKRLLVSICLIGAQLCGAQKNDPEAVINLFRKYPSERVFLQLDKGEYLAGETVRFKGFVFCRNTLTPISTNLYVECLDEQKKIVYREKLPLAGGVTSAAFALPKDLQENVYYLRAYTSWMLNFPEKDQGIFSFAVYNPRSPRRLVPKEEKWTATCHAESGQKLLDGVETEVAVRLHARAALPASWKGFVFEGSNEGEALADVSVLNSEVGLVSFFPEYGKKYTVKLQAKDGSSRLVALPAVEKTGVSLKIAQVSKGLAYRISTKGLKDGANGFQFIAHLQGRIIYMATIKSSQEAINGLIELDSTHVGVVHLSLFDPQGAIAAERLCFANQKLARAEEAKLTLAHRSSAPRGRNEWVLNLDTVRHQSYTVLLNGGASPALQQSSRFLSTLWLEGIASNTLMGNWYFDGGQKAAAEGLDALLLSEKWNRWNWADGAKGLLQKPVHSPDHYITALGKVTSRGRPVGKEGVTLLFILKDSSRLFTEVQTDSLGEFRLKGLYFQDTATVYYHLTKKKNAAIKIDVSLKALDKFEPYKGNLPLPDYSFLVRSAGDTLPARLQADLNHLKNLELLQTHAKMLDEVKVSARARSATEKLNKELSSPMFRSVGESVFDFVNEEQDLGASTIIEWLAGRVPGLTITRDASGNVEGEMRGQAVRIFVDEFEDTDGTRMNALAPMDVAMVKVIRNSYMINAGGGPVVAIYMKRGQMAAASYASRSIPSARLAGYVRPAEEEFSLNRYSLNEFGMVDTRNILYWNAQPETKDGKLEVVFHNNDSRQPVQVLVLGFTATGRPVFLKKEVK